MAPLPSSITSPRTVAYVIFGSALVFASSASGWKSRTTLNNTNNIAKRIIMTTSTNSNSNKQLSPQELKTSRLWDRFADGYHKSPIKDEESYQKKLEMTREYLTPKTELLEFGCGTGGTSILHAPRVKHVHAIDISSRMIEIANEKKEEANVKNVDFECMGIDSLDEKDGTYDVILGLSILHLLPNKDENLAKVHRLLKPGGYFMSSTICMGDMGKWMGYVLPAVSFLGVIPKLNIFSKRELLDSMENAGFTIEREFHPGKDKAVFLIAKKKEE